jgi:hypothetical protein
VANSMSNASVARRSRNSQSRVRSDGRNDSAVTASRTSDSSNASECASSSTLSSPCIGVSSLAMPVVQCLRCNWLAYLDQCMVIDATHPHDRRTHCQLYPITHAPNQLMMMMMMNQLHVASHIRWIRRLIVALLSACMSI